MENKYSLAFIPDSNTIEEIKKMKLQLGDKIGWYNSKNSLAHITICEFSTTENNIEIIKKQINRKTSTYSPIEIELNGFDSYPNGAFFIKPSEDSKSELKNMMKSLTNSLTIKDMSKSSNPHLSIARKLDDQKLNTANNLFQNINLSFLCHSVFLRKFNPSIKQFEIIDSFEFKNENSSEEIQGSLF